jgi:hypothetical protein
VVGSDNARGEHEAGSGGVAERQRQRDLVGSPWTVNAPSGTNVSAKAEGFFKSTEITRQTQMLPADMGPTAGTGISAAAGVMSNGTA